MVPVSDNCPRADRTFVGRLINRKELMMMNNLIFRCFLLLPLMGATHPECGDFVLDSCPAFHPNVRPVAQEESFEMAKELSPEVTQIIREQVSSEVVEMRLGDLVVDSATYSFRESEELERQGD